MTKKELAQKKGIILKEQQSPAETLITNKEKVIATPEIPEQTTKLAPEKAPVEEPEVTEPQKKNPKKENLEAKKTASPEIKTESIAKRGPGKPRKRKDGDRKLSFWLDEDLVSGLYSNLCYGESAGKVINDAIREYQKNHKIYSKQ